MHKKIHRHFFTKKKHYLTGILGIFVCFVFLFTAFTAIRGTTPHTSELTFVEYSVNGVGSVIPASEASPPPPSYTPPPSDPPPCSTCGGSVPDYYWEDWWYSYTPPVNDPPTVTIDPLGIVFVPFGQSYVFSSLATDSTNDVTVHNAEWKKPDGTFNWEGQPGGTINYTGLTSIPSGTGSNSLQGSFTPNTIGQYRIRFAAADSGGTRFVYSDWTYVNVVEGTDAIIYQDPTDSSKLRWECFNADKATLTTANGPGTNNFTDKTLPPMYGSINPTQGATYTIFCYNSVTSQNANYSYSVASLTSSNITTTGVRLTWNCNNPSAQSILLEGRPTQGGAQTSVMYNSGNSFTDVTGLISDTEYLYTANCFDGLNASGNLIGSAKNIFTTLPEVPEAEFTIGAYIQGKVSDPTTISYTPPIYSTTADGSFYAWRYEVTGGVPQSCVMDQRDDGWAWYPNIPHDTNISSYTLQFNNMTVADKTAFMSSFDVQHDWRITCYDSTGLAKSLAWSLVKTTTNPQVIDATLNLGCNPPNPPNPTLKVQCANADYYQVRKVGGGIISNGSISPSTPITVNISSEGTYGILCKSGGPSGTPSSEVLRTYTASMCSSEAASFIAGPLTIKKGGYTTLTWNINQPTNTCNIYATAVCSGTCSQVREDEVALINNEFQTGYTDQNDPYSIPNQPRKIIDAVQIEAPNYSLGGKGLGKKTLKLNYTTDFTIECGSTMQKVRVLVSNQNEG